MTFLHLNHGDVAAPHSATLRQNLRSEKEIMATWPVDAPPLVSICCATFNHAGWIEDAILGFLAQETTFPFEVIIRDDASTDGTTDVVLEYASRYSTIIKAAINSENEYKKGIFPRHAWLKLASGKYIALCEGDDFWISRNKLQKQVRFLEENPEFGLCCHPAITTYRQQAVIPEHIKTAKHHGGFVVCAEDLLGHNFIYTNSAIFKKSFLQTMPPHNLYMGDWPLWMHITSKSLAFFHIDLLGFYRQHPAGIWSSLSYSEEVCKKLDFYDYIQQAMPSFTDKVASSRRNYVKSIALSHESLMIKVVALKRNPIKFILSILIRKFLGL